MSSQDTTFHYGYPSPSSTQRTTMAVPAQPTPAANQMVLRDQRTGLYESPVPQAVTPYGPPPSLSRVGTTAEVESDDENEAEFISKQEEDLRQFQERRQRKLAQAHQQQQYQAAPTPPPSSLPGDMLTRGSIQHYGQPRNYAPQVSPRPPHPQDSGYGSYDDHARHHQQQYQYPQYAARPTPLPQPSRKGHYYGSSTTYGNARIWQGNITDGTIPAVNMGNHIFESSVHCDNSLVGKGNTDLKTATVFFGIQSQPPPDGHHQMTGPHYQ